MDGLSSLVSINGDLHIGSNQLTNLDGLSNLIRLGGYLAFHRNFSLKDISGVENIIANAGRLLYIDLGQYITKANENLKFCSATWDLRDPDGNIADDMTKVCDEGVELSDTQKLRATMEKKCSISFSKFANSFDEDTGTFNGSLDCSHNQMSVEDLASFSLLNHITGSFSINDNSLTRLDGLSNLISIGDYFYLHNNQIQNLSGLYGLEEVKGNLNLSNNLISSMDGLNSLSKVSGTLKFYNNANLTDLFAISNIVGFDAKKIYIDARTYNTKADLNEALCSSQWDIYDTRGNIADDMSKICEGYTYTPSDADNLRDLLGKLCDIDSLLFYNSYAEDSSIYNGDIKCQNLSDEEMKGFKALLEVHGNFAIEASNITSLDELIRLKNVSKTLSIWNNSNLRNINGISNIQGIENQKLIINDINQYEIKADNTKAFCVTIWNVYNGENNIADDMNKVCYDD